MKFPPFVCLDYYLLIHVLIVSPGAASVFLTIFICNAFIRFESPTVPEVSPFFAQSSQP